MIDRLLILVVGGSLSLAFFVIAVLLTTPRRSSESDRTLVGLVAVAALNVFHAVATLLFPQASILRLPMLIEPLEFLIPPFVASYYRVLITGRPIRAADWPHTVPFLLAAFLALSPLPVLWSRSMNPGILAAVLWALLLAEIAVYYHFSFRLLARYRRALREETSNVTGLDLEWLAGLSWLIVALFVGYALVLILMLLGHEDFPVRALLAVLLGGFIAVLGYRGMIQNRRPSPAGPDGPALAVGVPQRAVSDTLPPEKAEDLRRHLEEVMETRRPWLDPDLDLSALAEAVSATRNHLSFVVNRVLSKNFYDFVNEYRVREVLRLMADPARDGDKVLSLAFDAGFNSKATFNKVMAKLTGKPPSQVRSETIASRRSR